MTLTRYVTLYLYNPILLGVQRRRLAAGKKISRKSLATVGGFSAMVAYPTIITMLLTGLWHGAGLQFVLFGLLHGIYLTANQAWRHFRQRKKGVPPEPPTGLLRMALRIGVYLQVSLALVFFRADSTHAAFAMLRDLFAAHGIGHIGTLLDGALGLALFPVVWFMPNTQQILGEEPTTNAAPTNLFPRLRWSPNLAWGIVMAVLFFAILANLDHTSSFLYFQF
jgi:hypothetical protein